MNSFIYRLLSVFLSEECMERYFITFDFFNVSCFKALLSKVLGFGIIAGSLLVKVPQILKLLANKSAAGINLGSVLLDLLAISIVISYSYVKGFPFSAWGDGSFLALQTATIAFLVIYYNGAIMKAYGFLLIYSSFLLILMGGTTPINILWTLTSFTIPILLVGKLSQAWTNYKNQSTGQLSLATSIMLFAGSIARIFTSYQETGDVMMILTYCASTFANGVIVSQFLLYKEAGKKEKSSKSKVVQKEKAKKIN